MRTYLLIFMSIWIAGCGGGEVQTTSAPAPAKSAYDVAVEAAKAQAVVVKSLADISPCTDSLQCSTLALSLTFNDYCMFPDKVLYSTQSATAQAALDAAGNYELLARKARDLAPPLDPNLHGSCWSVESPPLCINNKCTY